MDIRTSTLFRNVCVAASFFALADVVHAGVITSGATVLESETFVINSATSSLAYNPGTFSFGTDGSGGPSPTVNYIISGSFDVTSWTMDNGNTKWLSISHVNLSAINLPTDFQMPDFINSQFTGGTFSGNGDICSNIPSGVIASCTTTGAFPTIVGERQNGAISFKAFVPVGEAAYGGGSTYQINATASVVPIPAAFWLFASVIGFCGFKVRQKNQNAV
ncbi:MAG: hypothetical protein LUQ11_03195 [Methylococcaceae bacterium]|nr:hypothetical protein [Methylococcaceae bacterium]